MQAALSKPVALEVVSLAVVTTAFIAAQFHMRMDWQQQNTNWAFQVFVLLWALYVIGWPLVSALHDIMNWILTHL